MDIYTHRGFPYGENTIDSFLLALGNGATGVELDLRLTRDEKVVVEHSNGIRGYGRNISDLTLDEIRARENSWRYHQRRIPTLSEVLEALPIDSSILLHLQTGNGTINKVLETVSQDGKDRCILCSYVTGALEQAGINYPRIRRSLILPGKSKSKALKVLHRSLEGIPMGIDMVSVRTRTLTRKMVEQLHEEGYRVCAYMVDKPWQARIVRTWGIDSISTNRCDVIGEIVKES